MHCRPSAYVRPARAGFVAVPFSGDRENVGLVPPPAGGGQYELLRRRGDGGS